MSDEAIGRLDAVTEVILREADELIEPVAVLDDVDGALTAALLARGLRPRVWCDDLRDAQAAQSVLLSASVAPDNADPSVNGVVPTPPAIPANTEDSPSPTPDVRALVVAGPSEAVQGARTVLWRLPKAVGAVEEYAQLIAAGGASDVRVVAGGRDKHLSRSMNEALGRHFTSVSASLGHRKARALFASGPQAGPVRWPRLNRLDALDLTVAAHGATFSTNRLDHGTSLLVSCFDRLPDAARVIDLGCGSGIMAALLARQGRQVTAVDVTWSGCDSARLTAEANDLSFEVVLADGLAGWTMPVDLIVLNPPFHVGSAKDSEPTRALMAHAGQALVEGGELWCVYNAHLPYLDWLRHSVGPTRIVARDRAYIVTASVKASSETR